jgi:hypothetical protein
MIGVRPWASLVMAAAGGFAAGCVERRPDRLPDAVTVADRRQKRKLLLLTAQMMSRLLRRENPEPKQPSRVFRAHEIRQTTFTVFRDSLPV